jgi:hypothetical protein
MVKTLRDVPGFRFPARISLLITLLLLIYLATRRGVGAWSFRETSLDAIQKAMKWDPLNPAYYDALGTLTHLYASGENSNEIVQLYKSATRLSPHDAQLWADLGDGYDWAGRTSDALEAFQRARSLFPNSPDINWRLANFNVREGKIPEALRALRMVLLGDSTTRRRVFVLAANATHDGNAILEMLPPRASDFFDYLNFQLERDDIDGASESWARVLQLNFPFDLGEALPYFDALIRHRELEQLSQTWSALAQRFPAQVRTVSPGSNLSNLVTNGGFESDILNGGLDWRVLPVDGAVVSLDSVGAFEGSRALRIMFQGARNVDYGQVFQYVPVQANTRYRFSGHMRVQGITTDSGPRFQVCDAYNTSKVFVSTENLVGTSGWSEQFGEFTTPADTRLLLVRIVRAVSKRLDNQIAGTVWIDSVRLSSDH